VSRNNILWLRSRGSLVKCKPLFPSVAVAIDACTRL